MKKRRLISLILILLIVIMSLGLFHTNAKYTSMVNGNVTTSVAKYVFNVTATDSYDATDTIDNLILAQTCDEKTLINGKIAPGTSGSFDIVVDSTGAEVGINYEISFSNNTEHDLPKNLVFTLDGDNWDFDEKISGTIDANAESKIFNHTILWSWAYETADDEGNTIIGDTEDTKDGKNAFDYSFTVTATGTQSKPLLEGEEPQPVHKHNYNNLIGKTIIDNKVYCSDDCDGIDVIVIVENKTVEINNVIYNVSNNIIVDKHTIHKYEGANLIPNGTNYKVACTECGEETIATNISSNKVDINGTIYNISENTVGNKYQHEHNYDNLIGRTIINNKVYCSDDCDGIDVTVVVENKTVKINNVIYNISNNVIVDKHTVHKYEGAILISNGSSYKIACTECKEEITGIKYENNGEVTIGGNTYSVTEDTKVIGNKIVTYVVKHWQQNVSGTASSHNSINYTLKDTENLKGAIEENITPTVKTYTGFNSPSSINTTIKADGTTEVNYYYTRKSYTVTLNKGTGISSTSIIGNVSGTNKSKYLYGETVTINATLEPGYTWLNWTGTHKTSTRNYTFEISSTSITDTANAKANTNTPYTVNYWQQNVNGVAEQYDENNYTKYETKTYIGTTGTTVIAKLEEYEGFITPEEQSVTILGDGSAVIDYYYLRNITVDSSAFITECTLTLDNTTITLPIETDCNIIIDWGDGTVEEKSSSYRPKHTYINAGIYNISITGNLQSWDFEKHSAYLHEDNNYITGILQWGEVGFTSVNFSECSKLKNIPEPTEHSFDSVIDFSNLFNNCTGLEGNIPENLFKNCINANNFVACFKNCTGLTGNIPEGLFVNSTKCKRYGEAFSGCTGLTGNVICDNIFNISAINSTSVAAFNETFKNCTGLTSANINNNKIQHTFEGCTNLTDIILGDNVSLIYTNSFYVPSNTQTVITTNNDVVLNYDWSADNRTVTFK